MARIDWYGTAHVRDEAGMLVVRRGTLEAPYELASVFCGPQGVALVVRDRAWAYSLDEVDALIAALREARDKLAPAQEEG